MSKRKSPIAETTFYTLVLDDNRVCIITNRAVYVNGQVCHRFHHTRNRRPSAEVVDGSLVVNGRVLVQGESHLVSREAQSASVGIILDVPANGGGSGSENQMSDLLSYSVRAAQRRERAHAYRKRIKAKRDAARRARTEK